jgi:hypothetical protein
MPGIERRRGFSVHWKNWVRFSSGFQNPAVMQ